MSHRGITEKFLKTFVLFRDSSVAHLSLNHAEISSLFLVNGRAVEFGALLLFAALAASVTFAFNGDTSHFDIGRRALGGAFEQRNRRGFRDVARSHADAAAFVPAQGHRRTSRRFAGANESAQNAPVELRFLFARKRINRR